MNSLNYLIVLISSLQVTTKSERYLLIYMIFTLVIITTIVIVFFVVFQKRKNKLLLDKIKQQQVFEEEISNTQIEIQEQTLKNIGQELHDNIGQLLSVANMQLSIMTTAVDETIKEQFSETRDVVKDSLREVRALSKSLNSDVIANKGFHESIQNEIDRLNRLKILNATLTDKGDKALFENQKDSIILFRIFQEFISNTVKYASAKNFSVTIEYMDDKLILHAKDNGKGFDIEQIEKGAGLMNMRNRANLINATYKLESEIGKGTELEVIYPYRKPKTLVL
ncbi:sensor histidine kinase [Hanstruepera ponticola]|uniref:sensor histidine kinase n=1 Tax=Hanstruepera ponticola TaxID=2042995 RepID=UPI001E347F8F|nr:sensor histidine kinase [Hanstruepera ponticola]